MMNDFDELNDKVLQKLRKCKGKKTCEGLSCRRFYFEPNEKTIKKWQEEGLYKKGIDRRVIFVCESPGPATKVEPKDTKDIKVKRCWGKENVDPKKKTLPFRNLNRFLKIRKDYGLENCYITNIVKCGPRPKNHAHHDDKEIKKCYGYLKKEIDIIKPEVVVLVGGNVQGHYKKYFKFQNQ